MIHINLSIITILKTLYYIKNFNIIRTIRINIIVLLKKITGYFWFSFPPIYDF